MGTYKGLAECVSRIADAQSAHERYMAVRARREDWLAKGDRAEMVLLHDLLHSIVRRRDQGKLPGEDLPDAEQLDGALMVPIGAVAPLAKAALLDDQVQDAARELVAILVSDEFLDELDALPIVDQLRSMYQLSTGLGDSDAGISYLAHTVLHPLESSGDPDTPDRLQALHLERLRRYEGDFVGDAASIATTTANLFAGIAANVLPGVYGKAMAGTDLPTFIEAFVPLLDRFHPDELTGAVSDRNDLRRAVGDCRQAAQTGQFGIAGPAVLNFLAAGNVVLAIFELDEDPDARDRAAVMSAVLGAATQLTESVTARYQRHLPREAAQPAARALHRVSMFGQLFDVALSGWDAGAAVNEGDWSVAAGHTLSGIGSIVVASSTATVNPIGFAAGALLVLGGKALTMYTQDPPPHPLVQFFRRTYFGTEWGDVDADASPGSFEYRWKHRDSRPNLVRQVSELFSLLHPLRIDRSQVILGSAGDGDGRDRAWVNLGFKPRLVAPGSGVSVHLLVADLELSFLLLPVDPPEGWRPERPGVQQVSAGHDEEGRVVSWFGIVYIDEPFPLDVEFAEIVVALPSRIDEGLFDEGTESLPSELDPLFSLGLRERAAVEAVD